MKLKDCNFVFTVKIDVDAETWIEVREPSMLEFKQFQKDESTRAQMEAARKLIPSCIVDSNFEGDDGEKASGADIWKAIEPSASLSTRILNKWLSSIPFRIDENTKASD